MKVSVSDLRKASQVTTTLHRNFDHNIPEALKLLNYFLYLAPAPYRILTCGPLSLRKW